MTTDILPDVCTSYSTCKGYEYCSKCSHAIVFGSGVDINNKLWKWDYSPRFGPKFLDENNEYFYPTEDDLCWDVFWDWYEIKFKR